MSRLLIIYSLLIIVKMKKCIKLKLVLQLDCEKSRLVKVAPYIRVISGKKELVKGYVRKTRDL